MRTGHCNIQESSYGGHYITAKPAWCTATDNGVLWMVH